MLTVVIPAYNEENTVPEAAAQISGILAGAGIPFELLFVDDGSGDGTWAAITAEHRAAPDRVKGIRLSRNFGKDAAICAGLARAGGDCVCVIDCDLQHPPEKIVEMYRLWEQGYEIIEGVKGDRGGESRLHRFAAESYYGILSRLARIDMLHASDFKLLDRKAVLALINIREENAFFRALSGWVGFKTAKVTFDVRERKAGVSKWNSRSLAAYALRSISSFSSAPMTVVALLGILFLVIAAVFGTIALVQKFRGEAVDGFTTVILLQLISSSIIMVSLGIIGYYIARIYEQVKGRPRYIVSEDCGGAGGDCPR